MLIDMLDNQLLSYLYLSESLIKFIFDKDRFNLVNVEMYINRHKCNVYILTYKVCISEFKYLTL